MNDYPQPQPVLYSTHNEEASPQTQTAPVLTGPPRYPPAPPMAGDAPEPWERRPAYLTATGKVGRPIGVILLAIANFISGILMSIVFVPLFALVLLSPPNPIALLLLCVLFLDIAANIIIGVKLLELRRWARPWAIGLYTFLLLVQLVTLPFKQPNAASLVWDAVALIGIGYLIQPSVRQTFDNHW